MKIFVDACVILDFLQSDRLNHDISLKALVSATQKGDKLFVSSKSVTDIYYLIEKVNKNKKKSYEIFDCLMDFIDILDITKENILSALKMNLKDFEDAVAIDTAVYNSMDMILTDNDKDFRQDLIKYCTPREFINNYGLN